MYKRFYHLVTNPFRLAPEPDFCFSHIGYTRAREYLEFALAEGEGFVLVTGRPGTGKTLLVETFLKGINPREVVARRIAVSSFGAADLLRAVAYAYGIDATGMDEGTMRHRIQQFFVQQEQAGRRVLLIIDEAQTLSHAALEELRILADLQTQSRLMLQLFLVGQESLQELMCTPAMEQFQQRVIANYQLVPLNLQDTRSYIEHRLLQAGWKGDPEFSSAAVSRIYQLSQGVPRHINKICNRLLLLGYGKGEHAFDEQDVLEISAEMRDERLTPLEINLAPLHDTDNVTNISEIRGGQIAVTNLAIRVDEIDVYPATISEGSRQTVQNKEVFIDWHQTTPAISDEQISAHDIEAVAALAASSESLHNANASLAATHHQASVAKSHPTDRFGWKKTLAVTAVLLILLTVFIASVPTFPGRDGAKDMLSFTDHFSSWSQQVAALKERLGVTYVDSEIQVQAKGAAAIHEQSTVGVINRRQAKAKVPRSVVEVPVQATMGAETVGQTVEVPVQAAMGAETVGQTVEVPVKATTGAEIVGQTVEVPVQATTGAEIVGQTVEEVPVQATTDAEIVGQTDVELADKIERLFAQGRQALDDYRLVTPEGDNAYEYLLAVLQLEPDNVKAHAAIQEIVDIYITLAAKTADGREFVRAGRYIERGLSIQPDNPDLLALKDTVDRKMGYASVTHRAARAGGRLTRDSTSLQKQPSLVKRQAADRRRDVSTKADLDI